jgi:hypothetical protein
MKNVVSSSAVTPKAGTPRLSARRHEHAFRRSLDQIVGNREQRRRFDFRERANDTHKMRIIALRFRRRRTIVLPLQPFRKKAERNSGLETLKFNRSRSRELAKCLSGTGLEGFSRRKRGFLSEHCECLGLLGQRFELLA